MYALLCILAAYMHCQASKSKAQSVTPCKLFWDRDVALPATFLSILPRLSLFNVLRGSPE